MIFKRKFSKQCITKGLFLFITLILLLGMPLQVFAITFYGTPQTLDSHGYVGMDTSIAVVDGASAISYYYASMQSLQFIRAMDVSGLVWDNPQEVDSVGDVGKYTSLAVVGGYPAISYYDVGNGDLKFIHADNASGSVWRTPQTVDSVGDVGQYTSLAVVGDNPAISYYDTENGDLKFIRANGVLGWGTPLILDSTGNVGKYTSLAVVNGNPAISYYDASNRNLKFIRANDPLGSVWGIPNTLDSIGDVGEYTSLAVVGGYPAISYYDAGNRNLKFIRANNASGSFWGTPQTVDSAGNVGEYTSLAVVGGYPTISYYDAGNGDLKLIRANDANGSSWGTSQILDTAGNVGLYTSLAALNNKPAISYLDGSNSDLKFILVNFIDISVRAGGTAINDGDTLDFGTTTENTPVSIPITIQNSGDSALDLTTLSLPSGFSLTDAYSYVVVSGGSTNLSVRLDALNTGTFSGDLLIGSTDTHQSPFRIHLRGEVVEPAGEIAVWNGASEILDGINSIDFGATLLNTPITRTFRIENHSPNDLDLGGLSLPDGFSLLDTYDAVVANGASTIIQVRLDAFSTGTYNGTFSLVTDDSDENPFNFTITGEVLAPTLQTTLLAPVNGSTVLDSPIRVSFNQDVLHDGSADAANNPANYLLVENGANGLFETTSCLAGVTGDDLQYPINSVSYDSASFTATIDPGLLPSGMYQLLVCGTASIAGPSGNVLNDGAFDSSTTFMVISANSGSSSSTGTILLPATGFAPGERRILPVQPVEMAYTDMDSLHLQIPNLKVDVPIVGVAQTSTGWDVTWLSNEQTGWLNGSSFPTWEGNTVLTGHVTNASGNPGPFAEIKSLKFGDEIVLQAYGQKYVYEVRENKLVTRDNMNVVNEHKDHDWITLLTCEYYNEETGDYLYRRVVRAVLVEVKRE